MTLLGLLGKAARLTDIILISLAFFISHGVRSVHTATDANRMVEARYNQTVAVHQFDILCRARVGQCLIQMDTDTVSLLQSQLLQVDGVLAGSTLTSQFDDSLHTCSLVFAHDPDQTCATDITARDDTTGSLDDIGESLVLLFHRIAALEGHLTLDKHADGILEDRTLSDLYDIVGFQDETLVSVGRKVFLQGDAVGLGQLHVSVSGFRIDDLTGDIDLDGRGRICQSTSLKNQVLDGHALCIFVGSGEDHLTIDGQRTEVLVFSLCGDEEDILVLQRYISRRAIDDSIQVDREDLLRTVGFHAAYDRPGRHGFFGQAVSTLNERTDTVHLLAQSVHTRTEDGTLDLDHILETVDDRVDNDRVAIGHLEISQLKLLHIVDTLHASALAEDPQ